MENNNNNRKINLCILEDFNDLINHDSIIHRKIKVIDKDKKYYYQLWNQACTCVIRIRETSNYINQLELKRENVCRQAFSFYEFINLISIIFECTNSLFQLFGNGLQLKDVYHYKCFLKSNRTKINDIKFFKFIRSASSVHPNNTTKYNKITKFKHEFYPFALWNTNLQLFVLKKNDPKDFDIGLISWNSNPKCINKQYYLYIDEFYDFTNNIINTIENLIPKANKIISNFKEKNRCKKLKKSKDFINESEFCKYLRTRLIKKNLDIEFKDGGLLVASHVVSNKILDDKFKKYIYKKVKKIANQMLIDIEQIGFDDIFEDLNLFELNGCFPDIDLNYIAQKFYDYLKKETKREIETKEFINYRSALRHEDDNLKYNDAEWAVRQLFKIKALYREEDLQKATSFADLYEITLQRIWYYLYNNKEEK